MQAGSDCGFATFGKLPTVHPDIAWAKLGAMAKGAKIDAQKVNNWFINVGAKIYVQCLQDNLEEYSINIPNLQYA